MAFCLKRRLIYSMVRLMMDIKVSLMFPDRTKEKKGLVN